MANIQCVKCGRSMDEGNFYTYKSGGKTEMCKKCLTMHIDNYNPETFLWILEKMDVPYIEAEWNVLRDRAFAKDPNKVNGMSVFGKYISKMKLKQWSIYNWSDTEKLKLLQEEKQKALDAQHPGIAEERQEMKEKFGRGEISEAQYKTYMTAEDQHREYQANTHAGPPNAAADLYMSEDELIDPSFDLTAEDKIYLAMKWGRLYKPNQWVDMEKKYLEMSNSFDIQDSDTEGSLILICKTYLKMNEALDVGDYEAYKKLASTYDQLRKSAKFTAAQNKDGKSEFVDSVGELVALCEKDGFIPRGIEDIPQDKVDLTLRDMNKYVYKLVTQDLGFGQQIEDALKKIQIQKEMEADELSEEDDYFELGDEDIINYKESIKEQQDQDYISIGEGKKNVVS